MDFQSQINLFYYIQAIQREQLRKVRRRGLLGFITRVYRVMKVVYECYENDLRIFVPSTGSGSQRSEYTFLRIHAIGF